MAVYLRLFETELQYNDARSNDYYEPWTSLVLENSGVSFNKSEEEKLLSTPLTFEITGGGTLSFKTTDSNLTKTIEYRLNNGSTWTSMTITSTPTEMSVSSGDRVQLRGNNTSYGTGSSYYTTLSGSTAVFDLYGNIMSLITSTDYTTATTLASNFTFLGLFCNCTGLTSAENLVLPATTLSGNCYYGMFSGCTSLTTAPELPATTLATGCYNAMFYGCTSLAAAPELPATTLANNCYYQMFRGCTSLINVPPIGTTATTMAASACCAMFSGCTSLTTAPELPATTLANYCYNGMFYGCSKLNYIKCLATSVSASGCKTGWVSSVASSGTFVKAAGISESTWSRGTSGIPNNWTVEDA